MPNLNTEPIHNIQVRDVKGKLIEDATIKVIQRASGKILYNEKNPSGEVILDDIENLKDCHAFRVEIEHPNYKSKPKTEDRCCIRASNLHRPHILYFPYQDKLLVSSVSAELKDNTAKELESNAPITIYLKAYYNQDSISNKNSNENSNKNKQSNTQQQTHQSQNKQKGQDYQEQKAQTKWGYIVFDKDKDIDTTLKELTKDSTIPIKELKEFQEITDKTGEEIDIVFKEEWEDKQVRFFAYIYRPHKDVGVDVEFEESTNVIRIRQRMIVGII